ERRAVDDPGLLPRHRHEVRRSAVRRAPTRRGPRSSAASVKRIIVIAAVVAGCAGHRAALGTLTPPRDRITDEAIAADRELFRSWSDRLARLEADTMSLRAYQAAKARGWLAFAQEEYTDNDRTQVVGDALAQAQQLIVAMERSDSGAGRETPLVTRTARVRNDLWNEAERFKG